MLKEINIVVTELMKAGIEDVIAVEVVEDVDFGFIRIRISLSDGYRLQSTVDSTFKENFRYIVFDAINKILNHYKEGGEE